MDLIYEANQLRRQWAENDAKRDASIPMPHHIKVCADIPYTTSQSEKETIWHLMDLYYPMQPSESPLPVIVNVHGGGWFYGDKLLYSRYTKFLAEQGFAVVNFNYRLAPEFPYPCGFLDLCRLMDFIVNHAQQYHLDSSRLFMIGDSAGAQFVSQYAILAANPEYKALFSETKTLSTPIPAKVVLNCGIYEFKPNQKDLVYEFYLPKDMTELQKQSAFHILDYMNEFFPPAFLMVSVNDALLHHSDIMKEKLCQLHIPHLYREYGHDDPSDGHVFHINFLRAEAQRCNQEELAFLRGDLFVDM